MARTPSMSISAAASEVRQAYFDASTFYVTDYTIPIKQVKEILEKFWGDQINRTHQQMIAANNLRNPLEIRSCSETM
jgi:hypothetical protein